MEVFCETTPQKSLLAPQLQALQIFARHREKIYTALSASAFLATLPACSKRRWRDICQEYPEGCVENFFLFSPLLKEQAPRSQWPQSPLRLLPRRFDAPERRARGTKAPGALRELVESSSICRQGASPFRRAPSPKWKGAAHKRQPRFSSWSGAMLLTVLDSIL